MITPILTKQLSADGFFWNLHSPRVATTTNELTHFARVCYFSFDDWDSAHAFWKSITDKRQCTRAQVREAERFDTGWEVKTWNMPQTVLKALIERDRTRQAKALPLPPLYREWESICSTDAIRYEAVA